MDLGTVIKNIRKDRQQTQNELAANCDITQTYLSQIEGNKKEPNLSVLKKISACLDVPLPVLFFLSLNEQDIDPNKREAFKLLNLPLKNLVGDVFGL
ncbi:transcriptional regulator with XRE-family HTH domain [Flavobacterium gossypii]|uniref:Transcriptional regulator with XRE-family HTH domain n=1 Tax=Flavobacterium gossypii TaxID=1646119 RepID=A0ABR6DTG1_9FLAO|nr:helix-turn-helix transcriptional regulator [Flavobacterium gossypii]MBA9074729.1 transcriptional regulator with XRE-family HTH domain [Flavobacterium gossypii]